MEKPENQELKEFFGQIAEADRMAPGFSGSPVEQEKNVSTGIKLESADETASRLHQEAVQREEALQQIKRVIDETEGRIAAAKGDTIVAVSPNARRAALEAEEKKGWSSVGVPPHLQKGAAPKVSENKPWWKIF